MLFWVSPSLSFFLNASIAPTCTATIIPREPCALNAKIQHFMLSFSISYRDSIKFTYFTDTTRRGVRLWKEGEDRVNLWISLMTLKFSGREFEGDWSFQLEAPHDSHFAVRFSQYCVIMNHNEVLGRNGRSSLLKVGICNIKRVLQNNANPPKGFRVRDEKWWKSSLSCVLYHFEKWQKSILSCVGWRPRVYFI